MNHELEAQLFKAYYIARWSSYVPFHPGLERDWYEVLGVEQPNGTELTDIFPLKDAQVTELQRIWALP